MDEKELSLEKFPGTIRIFHMQDEEAANNNEYWHPITSAEAVFVNPELVDMFKSNNSLGVMVELYEKIRALTETHIETLERLEQFEKEKNATDLAISNLKQQVSELENLKIRTVRKSQLSVLSLGPNDIVYCQETNALYVGSNPKKEGNAKPINTFSSIYLVSPNGKKHSFSIGDDGILLVDGKQIQGGSGEDNPTIPDEPISAYDGLLIVQVYGGGNGAGASYHFVELYNNTKETIDLSSLSLFGSYYKNGVITPWQHYQLSGSIPPKHSFLIQGIPSTGEVTYTLPEGDYKCNLKLDKGMKVFLIETSDPEYLTGIANPFNYEGNKVEGYIDGFGCSGNSATAPVYAGDTLVSPGTGETIDGFEGEAPCGGDYGPSTMDSFQTGGNSKQNALRRRSLVDTDNNARDFEIVRYANYYSDPVIKLKVPRRLADGEWEFNGHVELRDYFILHVSDSQADTEAGFNLYQNTLKAAIAANKPDIVLHTGDCIEDTGNNVNNWTWFKTKSSQELGDIPLYTAKGNNDLNYDGQFTYENADPNNANAYYFVRNNVLHLCLDSEGDIPEQITYAEQILNTVSAKWKIVFMHRAPYTAIKENTIGLATIFEKYNVDLVLTGHKHMYMRSYRIKDDQVSTTGPIYIMGAPTGIKESSTHSMQSWMEVLLPVEGPSFNTIEVKDNELFVKAYKYVSNQIYEIDSCSITKVYEPSTNGNYIIDSNGDYIVDSDGGRIIFEPYT